MAVKFRDYYDVLGVKRDATEAQIRQAYRKLARKHHPDVNPGDKIAEERFKELNEANEVLSDSDKRKRYDQLGANWKDGVEFTPPPGWSRVNLDYGDFSNAFGGGGFSDFFETVFGRARAGAQSGQRRRAGRPKADTRRDAEAVMTLSLEDSHKGGRHKISLSGARTCPQCDGAGEVKGVVCLSCRGAGQLTSPKTIEVNIPPGARDGSVIKVGKQGQTSPGGREVGDLFIKLKISPHPIFTTSGDDLTVEIPVAPWEAVLGASIEVPTIEGKAEIKVPPGAQGGQRMRLRGQGLNRREGGRGDQYVRLKIVVPSHVTEKERELYRELARAASFNPRRVAVDGGRRED